MKSDGVGFNFCSLLSQCLLLTFMDHLEGNRWRAGGRMGCGHLLNCLNKPTVARSPIQSTRHRSAQAFRTPVRQARQSHGCGEFSISRCHSNPHRGRIEWSFLHRPLTLLRQVFTLSPGLEAKPSARHFHTSHWRNFIGPSVAALRPWPFRVPTTRRAADNQSQSNRLAAAVRSD